MNNFDLSSKKYPIILVIICVIFVLLIVKAFDMAPNAKEETFSSAKEPAVNRVAEENNRPIINDNQAAQNNEEDFAEDETTETDTISSDENSEEISPIDENSENIVQNNNQEENTKPQLTKEEEALLKLNIAHKFQTSGQYERALTDYQAILDESPNLDISANCYEEMAKLHGAQKHYGTALSMAQKAYNMEPTSAREVLLARLYYITGDKEEGQTRLNSILQREFLPNE